MGILSKIKSYLPVSKREFGELVEMILDMCDALETTDKQHSNIERSIMQQFTKEEEVPEKEDNKNHMEFA